MYGKPGCVSLNELRWKKSHQKKIMAKNLPPCDDSFMHHLERCAFQLIVWREAIVPIREKQILLNTAMKMDNMAYLLCPK